MVVIWERAVMKDSDMRINVDPFLKLSWTCASAGLMHVTFIITFAVFKMWMLVFVNVISILTYIISTIFTFKTDTKKYGVAWLCVVYVEVLLHAIICTFIQGMDVAFYLFPLMITPLCAYYLFIYCDKKKFFRVAGIMVITTLVCLTAVFIFVENVGTLYSLTDIHDLTYNEILTIRTINIIFTYVLLVVFTAIFYIEVMRLFSQLKESNKKLNYIATHDALTGLFNRHSLWKFFDELEESKDHYCVVMGDLDDFKKINDTYGHDCGDTVLKSVANVILSNMAENDMPCRWGGEEMLLVIRGTRDECFERVEKIKSEINALGITDEGRSVKVTMTFGFADSEEMEELRKPEDVEVVTATRTAAHIGMENLISVVDKRLYIGKRSGKNVIIVA